MKKNRKARNLLAQNKYYVLPVVNPDGVALIENDYLNNHRGILKKRKNMNPDATWNSNKGFQCLPEDSGVDLNRNYGVDFDVGEKTQVGLS